MLYNMKRALSFALIFLILIMPFAVANMGLHKGQIKQEERELDYIPNDVVSWKDWKDEPFFRDYDLSEYDSYKDFIYAQKDGDRPFVQSTLEADYHDTSLYMIGDVSVSVILPESIEGSEDWTAEEIAQVHAEVEEGITWWAAQEPGANLNFIFNYEDQVMIDEEAIEQNHIGWWLLDTMTALGYDYSDYGGGTTATWPETVYAYVNDKINEKETDWGFVVFVVDSSNDDDGKFLDGYFALASLNVAGGGPKDSGHSLRWCRSHQQAHL